MRVGETVVPSESANGFALVLDKRERRVRADCVAESLKFAVDAILSQNWLERARIEEDIDVFGETLDQVPAFRQARAAFEDDLVGSGDGDDP